VIADLAYRLRALFRRSAVERELVEELQAHLDYAIEKGVAAGQTRDEAERRARIALGGVDQIKEDCREAWGTALVETLLQDLRYGVRIVRRTPLVACTVVATISLTTAALATVFSLGHTLLLRRLPVRDASRLVSVGATRGTARTDGTVSYPDYLAFRDHAKTVTTLAAIYPTAPLFVTVRDTSREINGAVVSSNFFGMMGITPALGRFFRDDEDRVPDRDRVAVVSDSMWRSWFAASPDVLGAAVRINGVDFTVIGVAPPSFAGTTPMPIEIYIPTMMLRVGYRWCDDSLAETCTILSMMGRLAPGRTVGDAAAEFPTLMPAPWVKAPKGENSGIAVTQPQGMTEDSDEPPLVRNLAAAAVVLLAVCCANLTGLLGAQSASRAGEFSIRLSLGAAPRRIVRQVMTESLLLAGVGGLGGLLLSRVFIAALASTFFSVDDEGHPLLYDFGQTPAGMAVTMAAALAAGVAFSVIPALQAVRLQAGGVLKARSISSRWRPRTWLLAGQAAVAVAMAVVAILLVGNVRLMLEGRNYEPSHVALMRVRPRLVKYTPQRAQQFQREAVRRLAAVPGVESVTMVGVGTVLSGGSARVGLPEWPDDQLVRVGYNEVGPQYFSTLRVAMCAGREFDDRDGLGAPAVAIVNDTLARRLWPGADPLGATMRVGTRVCRVVGVVTDVPLASRTKPDEAWAYAPFWQNPGSIDSRIAIRVAGDPAAALPALVHEVNQIDPDVPIAETITLPIRMAGLTRPLRVGATFIAYIAMLTVLLTATGLYGTLAFDVSRRAKEIGIRLAMGAGRSGVVMLVVRQGAGVLAVGAAVGLAIAPGAIGLVGHLLYSRAATDWLYYLAGTGLVVAVGLMASWLPARRAAAVEPLAALRCE